MTPKFPITKSLKKKPPPAELRSIVEDFLQPKNLTRTRVTGYSPGHIRSLLDLDTFGPNHSQKVQAGRRSGILPNSPNASRFSNAQSAPGGKRLSGISERSGSPTGSRRPSVTFVEECSPSPSPIMKPSMMLATIDDDDMSASEASKCHSKSSKSVNAFSMSAEAIAEMDMGIRMGNPTTKRLQYAKNIKLKQEVSACICIYMYYV
jgi:hypothetical protein